MSVKLLTLLGSKDLLGCGLGPLFAPRGFRSFYNLWELALPSDAGSEVEDPPKPETQSFWKLWVSDNFPVVSCRGKGWPGSGTAVTGWLLAPYRGNCMWKGRSGDVPVLATFRTPDLLNKTFPHTWGTRREGTSESSMRVQQRQGCKALRAQAWCREGPTRCRRVLPQTIEPPGPGV